MTTWFALLPLLLAQADVAVVCPVALRPAIEPWVAYRTAQGHQVHVIDSHAEVAELRRQINQVAEGDRLRWVVLVGDAPSQNKVADPRWQTPTEFVPARVNVQFGSEAEIASDHAYGDLNGDGLPDVAVGRLSASSAAELSAVVNKILAYESTVALNDWRRRINVVAGAAGFGQLADWTLETAAKAMLTESIPAAYATSMTYANWRSPYCPPPVLFQSATLARHNEGCLFWVYLGHGQRKYVDMLRAPDGYHPVLHQRDVAHMKPAVGAPIAVLLACYTGAFDGPDDCLAESMLKAEGGPVAIICGSRVTMPYGMTVLGGELLTQVFAHRRATVGEVLLHAKRGSLLNPRDDARAKMVDGLANLLNPLKTDLADERAEHLALFNLLGDPLVRLRHPEPVSVDAPREVAAGATIAVRIDSPLAGEAEIELVVRRDRLPFTPQPRAAYDVSEAALTEAIETYHRANDPRLVVERVRCQPGVCQVELAVPADCWGDCHVRVFVDGRETYGLGSADVRVTRLRR